MARNVEEVGLMLLEQPVKFYAVNLGKGKWVYSGLAKRLDSSEVPDFALSKKYDHEYDPTRRGECWKLNGSKYIIHYSPIVNAFFLFCDGAVKIDSPVAGTHFARTECGFCFVHYPDCPSRHWGYPECKCEELIERDYKSSSSPKPKMPIPGVIEKRPVDRVLSGDANVFCCQMRNIDH